MKSRDNIAVSFLFLLLTITSSSFAQSLAQHGQVRSEAQSVTQVEGISSEVVDDLWDKTDYWWHHGDYPRIVALDRIISETDPHFLEPYATGGWLMESMGDNGDAEAYYRLGVANNPHKSYLWHALGMFYFNTLKNYPAAITAFQTGTEQPDGGVHCWKMLAHSYERNHQMDKAVATWQKIQVMYPDEPVTAHNLAEDLQALQAEKPPTVPAEGTTP